MTGEHTIDYEALAQDAMRGVVRTILTKVAKTGDRKSTRLNSSHG